MLLSRRRAPDPAMALARGLAVFACSPGGKLPAARGWQSAASADPAHVGGAWRPGDNVGVGCARSGVVVLDLDVPGRHGPDAGETVLARLCTAHGQPWPPPTLTVATASGGRHLYYRAPAGRCVGSSSGTASPLGAGVDVRGPGRGRGGYVIGPDSVVGGRRYRVVVDAVVVELPGWLADLLEIDPAPAPASAGVRR